MSDRLQKMKAEFEWPAPSSYSLKHPTVFEWCAAIFKESWHLYWAPLRALRALLLK